MNRTTRTALTMTSVLLLLAALAEQGEGAGGISGSGSTRGTLQRFASVVVNDAELETSQAAVFVNGAQSTTSALRVGQQVAVESLAMESGEADSIVYFSSVSGPIETIDTTTGRLRVVGQDVSTSAATNLHRVALLDLAPGSWVEVSGIRTGTSTLDATFLRRVPADSPVRLTGAIQRFTTSGNLRVAGVVVGVTDELRAGLEIGDTVSVRGTLNAAGTAIRATRIFELESIAPETVNVSVEGVVSKTGTSQFWVGVQAFAVTAATDFINTSRARLAAGDRVHVEATRTQNGLLAAAVVFRPTDDVRVEGVLDSIETLTPDSARIVVSGQPLLVNQGTDFGRSSNPAYNLRGIGDLAIGDYLEVRGYVDGREAAAQRLDHEPYDARVRIRALVSAEAATGFEMLGNTVTFGPGTEYQVASQDVTRAEFLAALEVGDFVEVEFDGDWTPGMSPDRVTLRDGD